MSGRAFLGIDLGTSGMRCLAVDATGAPLALERSPLPRLDSGLLAPAPTAGAVCDLVRRTVAALDGTAVVALAVTTQRQAIAVLDGAGRELYLGTNLDMSAAAEGLRLESERADLRRVFGHWPFLLLAPAKLRQLGATDPARLAAARRVVSLGGWLARLLAGELADERSLAAEAGLLDVRTGAAPRETFAALGLDPSLLGEPRQAGEVVGTLTASAAAATGLREGIPVTIAGADTQCALLGLGATARSFGLVTGWSASVQAPTAQPPGEAGCRVWSGLDVRPGRWLAEANAGDAGAVWERWARLVCADAAGPLAAAAALAEAAKPGATELIAALGPAAMDAAAFSPRRGGIFVTAPTPIGDYGRGDLLRAVLENVAFALRANVELLSEVLGEERADVYLGGGLSRAGPFRQIVADLLGRPVRTARLVDPSALGATMAAAVAAGEHTDLDAAVAAMRGEADTLEPAPRRAALEADRYEEWLGLEAKLKDG